MDLFHAKNLQDEANNLTSVAVLFIKYFCCFIVPLSVIGHLLNFYVFTRSSLRANSCGIYFLWASIFGLLNACLILPIRLIQTNYPYLDPTIYSPILCKTIWFFLYPIRSTAFWLIVLACVDRYCCSSSSARIRSWSNIHTAKRIILITILINFLVYIHVPIFFTIDIVPSTLKPVCYTTGPPGIYRSIINYCNLLFFGLFPPLFMFLFGILTIKHFRQRRRIQVGTITNNQNRQKNQAQMLRMLFIQVLVYSVTGLAFSIGLITTTAVGTRSLNIFEMAQVNLVNAIVGVCSMIGPCLSFFLFTLSSPLFRKELQKLLRINVANRSGGMPLQNN